MASQKSKTIDQITKEFGREYKTVATATKRKEKLQQEFFQAATEILSAQSLSRKTIFVRADIEVAEHVAQYHPGWRVVSTKPGESLIGVTIEEDPSKLAYSYVNPHDHYVYARTTAQGSPMLDDERLQKEDPELWEAISDFPEPWIGLATEAISHGIQTARVASARHDLDLLKAESFNNLNPQTIAANFLRDRGIQRALKPIDDLTDEQLQAIQDYLVPAPISVRLVAPRPAKQEELEEAGLV